MVAVGVAGVGLVENSPVSVVAAGKLAVRLGGVADPAIVDDELGAGSGLDQLQYQHPPGRFFLVEGENITWGRHYSGHEYIITGNRKAEEARELKFVLGDLETNIVIKSGTIPTEIEKIRTQKWCLGRV